MSPYLSVKAFSSKNNPGFLKHLGAVKFCIKNELSFPKETSEFFKGKVDGMDLEEIRPDCILEYIENGIELDLPYGYGDDGTQNEIYIKVSEMPKDADLIKISLKS